jgi:hypothetical protein
LAYGLGGAVKFTYFFLLVISVFSLVSLGATEATFVTSDFNNDVVSDEVVLLVISMFF